jgi:hypothetical protein
MILTVFARNRPGWAWSRRARRAGRFCAQGAFDPGGQGPGPGGGQVHGQRVTRAEVVADDRVLPRGDPAGVQVLLGEQQPPDPVRQRQRGYVAAHQGGGALVQGALGRAVRAALDPAVRRVRRACVDARQPERPAADPGSVPVAVGEIGGPAPGDPVEQFAAGQAAREPLHAPAAAGDPVPGRALRRVRADPFQCGIQGGRSDQVAPDHGHARERGMDVRVLEPRQQGPAAQVHDLGARADQVGDARLARLAHGHDPLAAHGHGAGPRPALARPALARHDASRHETAPRGVHGVDRSAGEDHIRLDAHTRSRPRLAGDPA